MLRLQGAVQNYDWGKIGEESEVGRLYGLTSGAQVQDRPYAELWMGTHDSAPAMVMQDKTQDRTPLKEWLQQHPEALGEKVQKRWLGELPFLFKVLSVAKALSIQAHPNKRLAQYLHQSRPNYYKDANHKPEMALALTNFEALCGFVSSEELRDVLQTVPELNRLLSEQEVQFLLNFESSRVANGNPLVALRGAFTTLMNMNKDIVAENSRLLVERLVNEKQVRNLTPKEELVLILEKQYPDDVGIFAAFFLNYIKLSPGEAVYLDADVPHAYLSGECIECMATSDNVVRAGLTSKYRDTQTLCSMLTYKQEHPEILRGSPLDAYTRRYSPPFDEFEVDHIFIPLGDSTEFCASHGPSIFLVFEGIGLIEDYTGGNAGVDDVKRGDIFFLPAGKRLKISSVVEVDDRHRLLQRPLHLYRAGVNSRVL